MTWQLWRIIRYPEWQHPIFQYGRRLRDKDDTDTRIRRVIIGIAIVFLVILTILFPIPVFPSLIGLIIAIPILLVIFHGTLLGAIWVTNIAISLMMMQNSNRYDLMRVTTLSSIGIAWQFALGVIYRHDWLRRVNRVVRWVATLILVALIPATLLLLFSIARGNNTLLQVQQWNILRDLLTMSVIVIFFWLDHMQSIIVAFLWGLLSPTFIHDRSLARVLMPTLYCILQIGTYLVSVIIYLLIRAIIGVLLGSTFIGFISSLLLGLLSFFIIREAILSLLVRLLILRYESSVSGFQHLLRMSPEL
ncbi:MAG: hypothetical protein AAF846_08380 [Chloroflexota bacterium]